MKPRENQQHAIQKQQTQAQTSITQCHVMHIVHIAIVQQQLIRGKERQT